MKKTWSATVLAVVTCLLAGLSAHPAQKAVDSGEPSQGSISVTIVGTDGTEKTVEIREPGIVKVEDLFRQADLVAIVQILSGDTEHYPTAIYKAKVLTTFKGCRTGEKIFFGPFIGLALGNEYLAFLRRSNPEIRPKDAGRTNNSGLSYGPLQSSYRIMYEGYSIMPIEYGCVFDGEQISQKCDYGIKINTFQVILPESMRTFPPESDDEPTRDKKWVRREELTSFLQRVRSAVARPNPTH